MQFPVVIGPNDVVVETLNISLDRLYLFAVAAEPVVEIKSRV